MDLLSVNYMDSAWINHKARRKTGCLSGSTQHETFGEEYKIKQPTCWYSPSLHQFAANIRAKGGIFIFNNELENSI